MSKKKSKRYWLSCVEQMVLNPKWKGYRNFRVEIYDHKRRDGYAVAEGNFTVPEELYEPLREALDWKEVDKVPIISWPQVPTPESPRWPK